MPALGSQDADERFEQGRLAAAVAADDGVHAALTDSEVEAPQRPGGIAVVADEHVVRRQDRQAPTEGAPASGEPTVELGARDGGRHGPDRERLGRQMLGLLGQMGRHDDGDAELPVHPTEQVQKLPASIGVEARGGLVEHEQPWLQREHPGKVHQLLLSPGELVGRCVHKRLDAEEVRDLRHAPAHLALRHADVFQPERDLVPDGVAHDLGCGILHDEADVGRRAPRIRRLLAEHLDGARFDSCGRQFGFEQTQKRGLPASGGSVHKAERAGVHLEGDVLENRFMLGVGEGEIADSHRAGAQSVRHSHHPRIDSTTGTSMSAANGMYPHHNTSWGGVG